MNKYELTPSELATAEAITDSIMNKIGETPDTGGIFESILHPVAHHADHLVRNVTRPGGDIAFSGAMQVHKFNQGVEKGAKDLHKHYNKVVGVRPRVTSPNKHHFWPFS